MTQTRLCRTPGRAFSLFELVLVISILGIITAIAIPRLSRGVGGTGAAALNQDLAILRKAIELFAAEHNGKFPAATADGLGNAASSGAAFVSHLTLCSTAAGRVQSARDATFRYGPYLRKGVPPLPVGDKHGATEVSVVTGGTAPAYVAAGNVGWVYNDTTGEIIPNLPDAEAQALGVERMVKGEADARGVSLQIQVGGG